MIGLETEYLSDDDIENSQDEQHLYGRVAHLAATAEVFFNEIARAPQQLP